MDSRGIHPHPPTGCTQQEEQMRENTKQEVREISHLVAFEVFKTRGVEAMTAKLAGAAVAQELSNRVDETSGRLRDRLDEELRKAVTELDLEGRLADQDRAVLDLARRVAEKSCADGLDDVRRIAREEACLLYTSPSPRD